MLDREKVIKGLHCCSHTDGANCIYCPYDISDTDCTALMAMDVLDLLKEQEEEPNANGWISVKDRLPEKEGQYLCWFGKNILAKGAAIATYLEMWKSFGSLESLETYPNVTHWMPIESPEEVKWDG